MHGGGERDVLGVPRMAGIGAEIAVAEVFLVHRRHPPRGQRISLDPRGSAHVALVEMDADKYRVRVFVRHGRAVFQGDENIGHAREADVVAVLLEKLFGAEDHVQRGVFFGSERARRPAVVPAVPGIEDHRAHRGGVLDFPRAHHRLDDLRHVHRRNQELPALGNDVEAEHVFDVVDEHVAAAGAPPDRPSLAGQRERVPLDLRGVQLVKCGHVRERDIAPPFVQGDGPLRGGRLDGGEQNEKNRDAHRRRTCGRAAARARDFSCESRLNPQPIRSQ